MQILLALMYWPLFVIPILVIAIRMLNAGIRKRWAFLACTVYGTIASESLHYAVQYLYLNGSLLLQIMVDGGRNWRESFIGVLLAGLISGLCAGLLFWLVPGIYGKRAVKAVPVE